MSVGGKGMDEIEMPDYEGMFWTSIVAAQAGHLLFTFCTPILGGSWSAWMLDLVARSSAALLLGAALGWQATLFHRPVSHLFTWGLPALGAVKTNFAGIAFLAGLVVAEIIPPGTHFWLSWAVYLGIALIFSGLVFLTNRLSGEY